MTHAYLIKNRNVQIYGNNAKNNEVGIISKYVFYINF